MSDQKHTIKQPRGYGKTQAQIEILTEMYNKALKEIRDLHGTIYHQEEIIENLRSDNENLRSDNEKLIEQNALLLQKRLTYADKLSLVKRTQESSIHFFIDSLKSHYPHSPSVCSTIDKVAEEFLKVGEHNDI